MLLQLKIILLHISKLNYLELYFILYLKNNVFSKIILQI